MSLRSFLFSIGIHTAVLLAIFWSALHASHYAIHGKTRVIDAVAITALPPMNTPVRMPPKQHHTAQAQSTKPRALIQENITPAHIKAANTTTRTSQPKKITGKTFSLLVQLIYRSINQHRIYPEHSQALNHTGNVLLSFVLRPNGSLSQLQVTKSSGHHDLDQAAIDTLRASTPITGIARYLPTPQSFTVIIAYQ